MVESRSARSFGRTQLTRISSEGVPYSTVGSEKPDHDFSARIVVRIASDLGCPGREIRESA
jgi:hypothetical protein